MSNSISKKIIHGEKLSPISNGRTSFITSSGRLSPLRYDCSSHASICMEPLFLVVVS